MATHTRNWYAQCGTSQELHTKKKITQKAEEKQRNGSYNKKLQYHIWYRVKQSVQANQELWFGFTNLCQEQKTTLNTGVTETELTI